MVLRAHRTPETVGRGSSAQNHYATLGIAPDSSAEQIRSAFQALIGKHRVRAGETDPARIDRARDINRAYTTLREPAKRRAYDKSIGLPSSSPPKAETEAIERGQPLVDSHQSDDELPLDDGSLAAPRATPGFMGAADGSATRPAEQAGEAEASTPLERAHEHGTEHGSGRYAPLAAAGIAAAAVPLAAHAEQGEPAAPPSAPDEPPSTDILPQAGEVQASPTAPVATGDRPLIGGGPASLDPDPHVRDAPLEQSSFAAAPVSDEEPASQIEEDDPVAPAPRRRLMAVGASALALAVMATLFLTRANDERGEGPDTASRQSASPALPQATEPGTLATQETATVAADVQDLPVGEEEFALPDEPESAAAEATRSATGAATNRDAPPQRASKPAEAAAIAEVAPSPASGDTGSERAAAATPRPTTEPAVTVGSITPRAPAPSLATGAKWIGGGLVDSDNPRGLFEGSVGVRFTVEASGNVTGCRPVSSSGNAALDNTTCALVERRLRFAPARDSAGRPTSSEVRTSFRWGRKRRN